TKYPLPTMATTSTLRTTQPQIGIEATLIVRIMQSLVSSLVVSLGFIA
ncbi:29697_t:CDS:1, partial [Gigaspora margarita]